MKVKVEYSDPSDWNVGAMGRVNCKTAKISIANNKKDFLPSNVANLV